MYESLTSKVLKLDFSDIEIYRMERIGSGKFGTVYQGYDKTNSRMVALKYLHNNKQETWKKQVKALELFDHPNIVKYYCYVPEKIGKTNLITGVYIVTQFVRGKTLEQYIESVMKIGEKGLSEITVLKLFSQLLDAYGEVHNKNYVHRDIKPQNILVDQSQNIKIIDFGQSKQRKLLITKGLGTPLYSAPQTFTDQNPTDFRRDVWSLGLVLYQMITGLCYFQQWKQCADEQKFRKHLQAHKIKIRYPQNFSPFWKQITKRMLQKDYTKRPNLHQIIFQLKKIEPEIENKLISVKLNTPIINKLSVSGSSGNTNPLTQSQNQFEFSRTKKYLKFFNYKHKFLIQLTQMLQKFNYPFLSNAHKLILVFVCYNIYVSAIDDLLERLKQNTLKINKNEIFDADNFQQPYRSDMIQYLKVYREYYQKQSRLTKDVMLQKIVPRFNIPQQKSSSGSENNSFGSSSSSSKQKIIQTWQIIQQQQYIEVKTMLQNFKQGIILSKQHCIQKFRQLVFSQEFYQDDEDIQEYFYQQDMVIYYLMLIISYFDDIIHWKNDYFGNQIPKLREQLANVKRNQEQIQQLIYKIRRFNKKL